MSHHDRPLSHDDQAFDSALAYHQHVTAGITTSHGHLIAAALAAAVADAEYSRAALARSQAEQVMFLRAGNKARVTRDGHKLAAAVSAVGEQVIGR